MSKAKLSSGFVEELTWDKARSMVSKVNPELAKVIDKVNPDNKHKLFKITYPYGSEILKKSKFYLPNDEGKLVPINDPSVKKHVYEALSYNLESNPVTLILKNSLELFLPLEDRTLPLYEFGAVGAGKLFGAYWVSTPRKSHQPLFIWDMTADARSIFMFPKISEVMRHRRLQKTFQIKADVPKNLIDHWAIFREIYKHPDFSEPWFAEILCFSKNWFEHNEDESWMPFNYYLLRLVWENGDFWRNHFFWDLLFSIIKEDKKLKYSPYIADTVKYLFAIGIGVMPGYSSALDSSSAPIRGLQEVYKDIYGLKDYPPVFMQPTMFNMNDKNARPVYYSLHLPNAIEFGPKARVRSSFVNDLYDLRSLTEKYIVELLDNKFNIEQTPLYGMIKKIKFDFFHNNIAKYGYTLVRDSKFIPSEDLTFSTKDNENFPESSLFMNGCIKVAVK